AVPCSNLGFTLVSILRFLFHPFSLEDPCTKDAKRHFLVGVLGLPILTSRYDPCRQMRHTHSRLGRVNGLSTSSARTECVDTNIGFFDLNIDILHLRQYANRRSRSVNPSARLRYRYTLHTM